MNGTIELGYSLFGPTIGLARTIKTTYRDFFIRRIQLTLVKDKDHSQHHFAWCLFRSHKMTLGTSGKGEEIAVELPFSFMAMPLQPHRYNILFNDQTRFEEIRTVLDSARAAWYDHLRQQNYLDVKNAYTAFTSTQPHVSSFTSLDRLCYWEPGNYRLYMLIDAEGSKPFHKSWSFSLSKDEESNLRHNTIVIMGEVCDQQNGRHVFAYPRYQN